MLDFKKPHGIRMVGLLEVFRYLFGWTLGGSPVFIWLDSQRLPDFRMFGLIEAHRFKSGCFLRNPSGFRVVVLFEAPRLSYSGTLRGPPVFV